MFNVGQYDRKVRPPRWAVSPTGLAAPYSGIWNKMEMCFPLWSWQDDTWDSGLPKDIATSPYFTQWRGNNLTWSATPNITWGIGPVNAGLRMNGTNNIVQSQNTLGGGQNRSIFAVVTFLSFPSSGYRSVWGLLSGGAWLCDVGVAADGSILFYEVTGGAVNLSSPAGLVKLHQQVGIVCVSDNSLGMAIYVDGRKVASNGTTGFLNIALQLCANLSNSPFTGNSSDFLLHMGGGFPWALREAEALALSRDPFGMIRPIELVAAYAEAGAPGSGTPDPAVSTWGVPTPSTMRSMTPDPAVSTWGVPTPTTAVAVTPNPAVSTWNVPAVSVLSEADDAVFGQVWPR